jgi:hypothetical protein
LPRTVVGSPETVVTKPAAAIRLLVLTRFDMAYALGRMPHEQGMAAIAFKGVR